MGAGEFKASLSSYKGMLAGSDRRTYKLSLGYVHHLSKRTAVYGTDAHLRNMNGGTESLNGSLTKANGSSNGLDLGVRHAF